MRSRAATRIALGVCALALALLVAGLSMHAVASERRFAGPSGTRLELVALAIGAVALISLGALVASRQPRNAIGWTFLLTGLSFAFAIFATRYVVTSFAEGHRLPFAIWAAWTFRATGAMTVWMPILVLLYLFPSGRLLSPRWRPVFVLGLVDQILVGALGAIGPEVAPEYLPGLANPLHSAALERALAPVGELAWFASNAVLVLGAVALMLRFRRSRGVERQQLKWIALSALFVLVGGLSQFVAAFVRVGIIEDTPLVPILVGGGLASIPVTASIAILRYRLWDIDRIITRTATYAVVTATLVGAYLGLVVVLQVATRPITEGSDIAVAASTLIVAAAFRPVRRRVQERIDHRFNRARYDIAKTIDAFSARLRNEVDIDALGADLSAIVGRTMQPAHLSIWMRET